MRESEIDVARCTDHGTRILPIPGCRGILQKIDDMAEEIRILTKGNTTPDYRIRAVNTYLFKMRNFAYDYADPMGKRPENRFLNGIIDNKKAIATHCRFCTSRLLNAFAIPFILLEFQNICFYATSTQS